MACGHLYGGCLDCVNSCIHLARPSTSLGLLGLGPELCKSEGSELSTGMHTLILTLLLSVDVRWCFQHPLPGGPCFNGRSFAPEVQNW